MERAKIKVSELNCFYGQTQALFNINLDIAPQKIRAFIGPSGCGKSTFLQSLRRLDGSLHQWSDGLAFFLRH